MTALIQIIASFITSFGFSLVFGIRRKYIWLISLDGALAWAVYLLCSAHISNFFSNLIAAFVCELYAAILARIIRVPTTVLMMPAIVPMLPGGSLYYTMHYALKGSTVTAEKYGMTTFSTIFGIATGLAIVNVILIRYQKQFYHLFSGEIFRRKPNSNK